MTTFIVNKGFESSKRIEAESFTTDSEWVRFLDDNLNLVVALKAISVQSVEKEDSATKP